MGDIYSSTMRALILLSFLAASALAMPQEKSILTCSLCIDIITDIDEFLTSDPTEQQVVDFAKQICEALGAILPDLVATCNALMESQLPAIIDSLVEENLNPQQVCDDLALCP